MNLFIHTFLKPLRIKGLLIVFLVGVFALSGCKKTKDTAGTEAAAPIVQPSEAKPATNSDTTPQEKEGEKETSDTAAATSEVPCEALDKGADCKNEAVEDYGMLVKCTYPNTKLAEVHSRLYQCNAGFSDPEDPKYFLAELPEENKTLQQGPNASTTYIVEDGGKTVKIIVSLPGGDVKHTLKQDEDKVLLETYSEMP